MINEELFNQKVEENGLKYRFLSQKLGITEFGLIKKRKGLIPFKANEITILSDLLKLSESERNNIFDP